MFFILRLPSSLIQAEDAGKWLAELARAKRIQRDQSKTEPADLTYNILKAALWIDIRLHSNVFRDTPEVLLALASLNHEHCFIFPDRGVPICFNLIPTLSKTFMDEVAVDAARFRTAIEHAVCNNGGYTPYLTLFNKK